jgi:transposase
MYLLLFSGLIISAKLILTMDPPIKILRRKKLDALNLCAQGQKQADVAYSIGISTATIKRAKRKQRLFGDIEGGARKRGPKPKMSPEIIDVSLIYTFSNRQVLLSMVHRVPTAYLEEYSKELNARFGFTVNQPQLTKILAKMGINRKKVLLTISH